MTKRHNVKGLNSETASPSASLLHGATTTKIGMNVLSLFGGNSPISLSLPSLFHCLSVEGEECYVPFLLLLILSL